MELCDLLGNDIIDTKCIVNTLNLMAHLKGESLPFPITSLSKPGGLKDILGIDESMFVAHDALGDCEATLEVLKRLVSR
jgi:DNA polymerase III epsilon subunit-like protein